MTTLDLNGRKIGLGCPCFIIAEVGVNHNGDPNMARQLVDAARQAGADAVKFQTFKAESLVTPDAPKAAYQAQQTGTQESQYAMLRRLELSHAMQRVLFDYCQQQGILFMSTPFDEENADFLHSLGVSVFKMASGELTNLPFQAHVARFGKPMIVSTGMATLGEVETALETIHKAGNDQVILLHCVSNYPAAPAEANLRAMHTMAGAFGVAVGFSDHTMGNAVALGAVALGACVIEKHITLDRTLPGPDHQASSEPDEFAALVRDIRMIEAAMGDGRKQPTASEMGTAAVARKSLVAAQDIAAGTILDESLIAIKRPGTGLPPAMRPYLIGRTARQFIAAGTLLSLDMLA